MSTATDFAAVLAAAATLVASDRSAASTHATLAAAVQSARGGLSTDMATVLAGLKARGVAVLAGEYAIPWCDQEDAIRQAFGSNPFEDSTLDALLAPTAIVMTNYSGNASQQALSAHQARCQEDGGRFVDLAIAAASGAPAKRNAAYQAASLYSQRSPLTTTPDELARQRLTAAGVAL